MPQLFDAMEMHVNTDWNFFKQKYRNELAFETNFANNIFSFFF